MEGLLKVQLELKEKIVKGLVNINKAPKARKVEFYLQTKLELLENQWTEFGKNHRTLLQFEEKTKDVETYFKKEMYDLVEENYIDYKCILREALSQFENKPLISSSKSDQAFNGITTEVKLPRIVLPSFSGKYTEWPTFHDLFESLIHNNNALPDVQKLHYLKGHLVGEAEQLLRHIPITEANYLQCWNNLKRRYNNKRYIANCLLTRLFNQRSLTFESANGVKNLLDTTCDCLNALSNLGIPTISWDVMIIHLVTQKLDLETKRLWEQKVSDHCDTLPTFDELKCFMESRFRALEFLQPRDRRLEPTKTFNVTNVYCTFCKENHLLHTCKKFAAKSYESRLDFIDKQKLCHNCFGSNHSVNNCWRQTTCRRCGLRHHSLLHPESRQNPQCTNNPDEISENLNIRTDDKHITTHFTNGSIMSTSHQVILATALVKIRNKNASNIFRALLDQGSEASFITEHAVQSLGLYKIPVNGTVQGLGGDNLNVVIKYKVNFRIQSICYPSSFQIQAYVLNRLSSTLPSKNIEIFDWPELLELSLADPGFGKPGKIDLLLGADIYSKILSNGLIRNPSGTIIAQNTTLGWILSGRFESRINCNHNFISMHIHDITTNELLRKFWELESDIPQILLSEEDKKCERYYETTTTRDDYGRYIVRLPFNTADPPCQYGELKEIAMKRFLLLEKRLTRNPNLKREYSKAINDYLELDHMELVSDQDEIYKSNCIYLPHHAVIREDRVTTKVRIVFDASCKGRNGHSLNDDLLIGPRLQPELRHIIMKWRTHPVCFVADIIKMYRQVLVNESDTKYQRLLWRENPDQKIQIYRMMRVTFGVSSAPYLAVKTLQQVSKDEGHNYPLAADRIMKDFYMDDLMSGAQTEEEAVQVHYQMVELLKKGGFELQKWASNSRRLMEEIQGDKTTDKMLEFKNDEIVKILGLSWSVGLDAFYYKINLPSQTNPVTKRAVLSDIARLFDPLGWISPVIVQSKIFMQKLWLSGIQWDEIVPEPLLVEWTQFRQSLVFLNEFVIPRWIHTRRENVSVELHGFCDASNNAYGAVVYLRTTYHDGGIHVNLIASRTKVAPIKQVSIPRLELCGAVLLAKLLSETSTVMGISKGQIYAWTDSTVVLAWLKGEPNRWKSFVANRVTEILTILDNNQWSHVDSEQNPADYVSRGLTPQAIINNKLWLQGPEWLQQTSFELPRISDSTELELRSLKKVSFFISSVTSSESLPVWSKFSSLSKLIRVIAYCKRFILRLKHMPFDFPSYLTVDELEEALQLCITQCQKSSFQDEILSLSNGGIVSKCSRLSSLCPFLDKNGVMRVRGRIQQSQEQYDMKHPVILPVEHHFSRLIVAEAHQKTLHGGPQAMLNYIRSKYWIINVKGLIRSFIKKCIKCIRYSSSNSHPFMGELPSSRVIVSRPFSCSGVDYAGPINIRISKGRGCRCHKGYICLFVCMATRAIHLEAVSDLTTDGFLAAFKRFVGRRGHCQEIWSDNGTNFVGASKELTKLFASETSSVIEDVAKCLAGSGTKWHFIPPHAPNFGGLWEAGVRSTKFHLKRVLDGTTLTFEELSTVLIQIEACLNSRPMYRLPADLENDTPLTPGHFLVGEPLVTVPDKDYTKNNVSVLRRWQLSQRLIQEFWKRWSREYLTTLNQRYKWTKFSVEPQVGEVVLVKEDDLPPCKWLFGIIKEKHPGPDNITRVVTLKYKNGEIKRPISKLCVLPIAT